MREIKKGDFVVYQTPEEKNEDGTPNILIKLIEVKEVEGDTFNGDLKNYRVRFIMNGKKSVEYEGYDLYKIAVDDGDMTSESYEELCESKKLFEELYKEKLK